jgi:hypothetical protein
MLETPERIVKDEPNYKPAAWQEYEVHELGWWVHLFVKRALMRGNPAKAGKDLDDAQAYLDMAQAHINAAREKVG